VSVEVNPVGMRCERGCIYCYELPARRASSNEAPGKVDHARIQLRVIEAAGPDGFSLFGGEPLLASLEDLEKLWAFGLERFGKNGVQTDGHMVTEEHLALFARYRVHVGFSIDGPGELNDARVRGTFAETRAATAASEAALRSCLERGISCSLIVTLHRMSAGPGRLPQLLAWLQELAARGLRSVRLHALELDGGARHVALSHDDALAAFRSCRELERETPLRFDVFDDITRKLRDPDAAATCVWGDCDPWTTTAVHGIGPDGSRSGCARVHKDGRQWTPLEGAPVRIRQAVLWATPQEQGGCHGCRFFLQCGGQCPGTAIDGDWRMRSADCRLWFGLLEDAEAQLVAAGEQPASLAPDLDARIERRLASYAAGGQHTDAHGDAGHGDEHGDHTDHGDHGDLAPALEQLAGGEAVTW
jgi:uncharacterized protein